MTTLNLPRVQTRHFLQVADLNSNEIQQVLDFAVTLKQQRKSRESHPLLAGRSVAMYFEKPSNRTRVSFEVGIHDLGAQPIVLKKEEINLGVRESIADTARTLSRYVDGIMIRTFAQKDVVELARYASVPVINGLTDDHHPCQILADLLTVKEQFGSFEGQKLVYIGDGNNIANSLLEGCALVGLNVAIICPKTHLPMASVVTWAREVAQKTGATVEITDNIDEGIAGASVVYTDVWASMGQEAESEARKKQFQAFQVNEALMAKARPDAIVLHCLPAHLGDEITEAILEKHATVIFDQAENRLHAQKAIMVALLG